MLTCITQFIYKKSARTSKLHNPPPHPTKMFLCLKKYENPEEYIIESKSKSKNK